MAKQMESTSLAESFAQTLLRCFGPTRFALFGEGVEEVSMRLRKCGSAAATQVADPARLTDRDLVEGTVVVISGADDQEIADLEPRLSALRSCMPLAVAFQLSGRATEERRNWEQSFISAGFRKHAAWHVAAPYGVHAKTQLQTWEPLQDDFLAEFPLERLRAERDLHMDMTREAGCRSDAHLFRYLLAAQHVRDGDVVLDLACGLGYGSSILARRTRCHSVKGADASSSAIEYANHAFASEVTRLSFATADAETLSEFADASIDFLVSVETLEHLREPERFLQEAHRILKPAGRIFVSVPNLWVDETGNDPNPYHFHVYDWERLRAELSAGFHPERVWGQTAGGGMRLTQSAPSLQEWGVDGEPPADCEWILCLAMKDPLSAQERTSGGTAPNILSFERDYEHPAIVRAIVAIGWRTENRNLLVATAIQVLDAASPHSADRGAALCVLLYRCIEVGTRTLEGRDILCLAREYIDACGVAANPTVHRWKVSLLYASGQLHHALGDVSAAAASWEGCLALGWRRYSPLLATKTVAAAVQLGIAAAVEGETAKARHYWCAAVLDAGDALKGDWSEIVGDPGQPAEFGLPEIANVAMHGAHAAIGLNVLEKWPERAGISWQAIFSTIKDELIRSESANRELSHYCAQLCAAKDWLESHAGSLERGLQRAEGAAQQLASFVTHRNEAVEWLECQRASLTDTLAWLQDQLDSHQSALANEVELRSQAEEVIREKEKAIEWLAQQVDSHRSALENAGVVEAALREQLSARTTSVEWLEAQLAAHAEREKVESERHEHSSTAIQWLSAQLESHAAALGNAELVERELRVEIERREKAMAWLVSVVESTATDETLVASARRLLSAGDPNREASSDET
jgi:2-polyprenyl-3-methyl-5-hydroxy-6-metoxy-1,4-benzoquinol methylase